jgi:hypothetical protein
MDESEPVYMAPIRMALAIIWAYISIRLALAVFPPIRILFFAVLMQVVGRKFSLSSNFIRHCLFWSSALLLHDHTQTDKHSAIQQHYFIINKC